ncbi:integrase core domain-containing protein [Clostridium combesii]|uniref:Integrase catalytic domain-containing protein n=1 Tax=Clostridium combesii TaxID=39481 RepID=A0A2G7HD83_9CLOT|nr:hypothetical protein CS538_14445 [Clostridium combesii]
MVHTDQGPQFKDERFRALLSKYRAVHSNSKKGNPYDNSVMESFYRAIKRALIREVKHETSKQVQKEILKYIKLYYNTKRIHYALDYISPAQSENLNS